MRDSLERPGGTARTPAEAADERDNFRPANFMIALYHEQALAHAETHADQMLTAGDAAGYDAWLQVGAAIQRLLRPIQNETAAGSPILHSS